MTPPTPPIRKSSRRRPSLLARLRWACASAALLIATGCSSTQVYSDRDPSADFGAYSTFGFVDELGTDDDAEYGTLLSKHLRSATTRELESRGYQPSDEPDLLVNFNVYTKDRIRTVRRTSLNYYDFRRRCRVPYGAWGGYPLRETIVDQYTEGTLQIDVVDRLRRQVVWEAAVVGRVSADERENPRETLERAVAEAFDHYPR